jgi:Regulator of Chromosome Condensation (RCC1) repeat protein
MASLKTTTRRLGVGFLLVSCSSGDPRDTGAFDEGETATVQEEISSSTNTTLAIGEEHSCKIVAGGKVVCWGDNIHGKLGNGTTTPQNGAVLVSGITNEVDPGFRTGG